MGGPGLIYVWGLVSNFDPALYYDNDEAGGGPGPTPLDTVIAGQIPYDFDNSGSWQTINFSTYGFTPDEMDVGTGSFYLGYVLTGGGAQPFYPSLLGDAADDRPYHSLCFLTTPGGLYATQPGWYAYGIDWMIRAQVNMYGDPPPMISGLLDRPDTYAPGPYTITAYINDQAQGGGQGQVSVADLHYTTMNNPTWTVVAMTHVSDSTYTADIPAQSPYTIIDYYVEAHDNTGHIAVSPSSSGYRFTYLQPSGAHILLVNDGAPSDATGQMFYTNALQAGPYGYDLWTISPGSANDQGYPGSDVVNHSIYSSVLWFTGTANTGSLPLNTDDLSADPVAQYMTSGGNFFLTSSDYLGGAFGGSGLWEEFTAQAGWFMYDYLKVAGGWSDAHMNAGTGESDDTLYYGLAGDPISGDYTTPFENHPSPNYNDFVYPVTGATTCFLTQIDAEDAGIRYEGAYKVVFLPWILEATSDTLISRGILYNILDFFGEAGVINTPGSSVPQQFVLEQNYPNPFNPSTQIRFALPQAGKVELTIYNLQNQEVARLVNGTLNAGAYQVNWDANQFASGIYFYQLKTDRFVQSRKMVLVK
jgi:hypothetical protein